MYLLVVAISVFFFFPIYNLLRSRKASQSWSKGPWGLPLIGNLHQFTPNPPVQFSKWAGQFGKIFMLRFGTQPALIINDAGLMKKILWSSAGSGKPKFSALFNVLYPTGGVVASNGQVWKEQRTFLVRALRRFANREKLEEIVREEALKFRHSVRKEMDDNGRVLLGKHLKSLVSTIMGSIITGESKETNIAQLIEDWVESLQKVTVTGVAFFRWIGIVFPELSGFSQFKEKTRSIQNFVRDHVNADNSKMLDNIISAYRNHSNNMTDKQSSFYGESGKNHSFDSIVALLLAGTETTSTTLNWMIFYLLAYPDVQNKLREEIDNEQSSENGLSYAEAVIDETLRIAPVLPFGIEHELQEDLVLDGYHFPKGMHLLPNIYHVHFDETIWGPDMNTFRPERFLKKSGNPRGIKRDFRENIMSFQPGRRVCPGEKMARDVMLILIKEVIVKMEFRPVPEVAMETYLEADVGYIMKPKELPVLMTAPINPK